jgi:hypothetical protein
MRASWIEAETLGVDAIYNWDHFYPLYDDPDGPHFECWTLIAALAEATSRVEVGALVTCMSYRNPNLLADMARTVDHISNGRLTLGIGSGWFEKDYTEFGYEFGTAITRLHAFRDAIPVIKDRMAIGNPPPVRDEIRHKCEVLDMHCATVGRDPAEIERSIMLNAEELDGDDAKLEAFVDAGATFFIYGASGPDWPLEGLQTLLDWRARRSG